MEKFLFTASLLLRADCFCECHRFILLSRPFFIAPVSLLTQSYILCLRDSFKFSFLAVQYTKSHYRCPLGILTVKVSEWPIKVRLSVGVAATVTTTLPLGYALRRTNFLVSIRGVKTRAISGVIFLPLLLCHFLVGKWMRQRHLGMKMMMFSFTVRLFAHDHCSPIVFFVLKGTVVEILSFCKHSNILIPIVHTIAIQHKCTIISQQSFVSRDTELFSLRRLSCDWILFLSFSFFFLSTRAQGKKCSCFTHPLFELEKVRTLLGKVSFCFFRLL